MSTGGACYVTCFCDMTENEKLGEKIRGRNNLQTVKQAKQTDKQLDKRFLYASYFKTCDLLCKKCTYMGNGTSKCVNINKNILYLRR